ncbi:MAG: SoxR reducing system RseC family protein [Thermodesulfobacteriota bacterium]
MAAYMGVVIEKERGGRVRIIANRKNVCDDCGQSGPACRSCLAGAELKEWEASNPVGAETGDLVAVEMPASYLHARAAVNRVVHPGFKLSAGSVSTHEFPAACL